MTRDDITRMARESHLDVYGLGSDREKFVLAVECFGNLVAAAEREACAKIVDEMAAKDRLSNYFQVAAIAIRAREQ